MVNLRRTDTYQVPEKPDFQRALNTKKTRSGHSTDGGVIRIAVHGGGSRGRNWEYTSIGAQRLYTEKRTEMAVG